MTRSKISSRENLDKTTPYDPVRLEFEGNEDLAGKGCLDVMTILDNALTVLVATVYMK